ncbi:MAG: isoprenyl transferase [Candidatus Endonucleobacter bathymodioli]|uniref:Ditrans,polycis-undecaprenyl-diphosphate synthase ((2E,6E)-farnesyl-diphosphate specific) n=1 Tax=Candidatus Endonucleibacter bathymodioli TaxID=539814 RepID=A0AA90NKP9_9GAMM|nr:isoprenyl transferase [Candidatus Endonucleobacter bathymodioli]
MTTLINSLQLDATSLPEHIAIIMDGNNRWAHSRLLPKLSGHRAATEAVRGVISHCRELGIRYLTLFAFSKENWNRPPEEVKGLMSLLYHSLRKETKKLIKYNIRLRVIGDLSRLSDKIQGSIKGTEQKTIHCNSMELCVAVNYGGQWDIVRACKKLAVEMKEGVITLDEIDEKRIENKLSTAGMPPVDLLIRTSGEQRISNFLLWQCAYSEFYFTDTLWPDFKSTDLDEALLIYQKRERRFGKTSEQLSD